MIDVIYERGGKWQGVLKRWEFDVSIGEDDDFELRMPVDAAMAVDSTLAPAYGDRVFVPGTEFGGVVDAIAVDTEADEVTFTGRTWRGILSNKIIKPDSGQDYLTVSGALEECMRRVIARAGLEGAFEVSGASGVAVKSYKFARYVTVAEGLSALLETHNMCLGIEKAKGKCRLSAVPKATYSKGIDDNFVDYAMSKNIRPVNHLVCLGEGELKDRIVVHLYADASGNVSGSQTFTGVDEVEAVYDSNGQAADDLREDGIKKLKEYQEEAAAVELAPPEGVEPVIGDVVEASSVTIGLTASGKVCRMVLKAKYGDATPSMDYSVNTVKLR